MCRYAYVQSDSSNKFNHIFLSIQKNESLNIKVEIFINIKKKTNLSVFKRYIVTTDTIKYVFEYLDSLCHSTRSVLIGDTNFILKLEPF